MGNSGLKCPDIYFITYFAHVNREVGAFFCKIFSNYFFHINMKGANLIA